MLLPISAHVGYPVLAALIFGESAGLPLPGETALITAGGLAAAGQLSLPLVIATAAAAAIVGDTLGYWLGRRGGRAFLLRDGFLASHRRHVVDGSLLLAGGGLALGAATSVAARWRHRRQARLAPA